MSKPKQQSLFEEEELPENPMPWERESAQDLYLAEIVLNRPVDRVFHYKVPEELRPLLRAGHRVQVPLAEETSWRPGIVWGWDLAMRICPVCV